MERGWLFGEGATRRSPRSTDDWLRKIPGGLSKKAELREDGHRDLHTANERDEGARGMYP